jgi:hypothetical protein
MADPLLMTKVNLPILRHILVPREKVLRQLSQGVQDGHLLTLVSAPDTVRCEFHSLNAGLRALNLPFN